MNNRKLGSPRPTCQSRRGHPFYCKLNRLLADAGFDAWLEAVCKSYYADGQGRDSIPPGTYFRMILVGYFEGLASQRGIAWRCSDSRSLAEFLGYGPTEETPDHSSLTRIHQRLPQEVHAAMFHFVLQLGRGEEAAFGHDGGRRFDAAGGQRGNEEHRAEGHG